MTRTLFGRGRHLVLSRLRMLKRRFQNRTAPTGLPQSREGTLPEREAVAVSNRFFGWLNVPASIVTLHMLKSLPFGPVVEIGVYRGKYLSILRSAVGKNCRIVGYDIFNEAQAPQIEEGFSEAFGALGNLKLIQVDSTRLTADRVLQDCGGKPVFMSIDGSHEAGPVLSDMKLADAVLDGAGIVAMDDVLNPLAIGVNEGVARFLHDSRATLVPFAYVANKLFCCRPDYHDTYQQQIRVFLAGRGNDPSFRFYIDHMKNDENLLRKFFGYDVLIVTG